MGLLDNFRNKKKARASHDNKRILRGKYQVFRKKLRKQDI